MLKSGRSMIVDVATGLGFEELGNELVSIAREGISLARAIHCERARRESKCVFFCFYQLIHDPLIYRFIRGW